MKKSSIFKISFVIISFFLLSSCAEPLKNGDKTFVTSFYPAYVAALNVTDGVPNVNLVNMTPNATGCLHDYQLTTENLKSLNDAELFILNGKGMETFMDSVLTNFPDLNIFQAADGIGEETDPHIFTSVTLYIEYVKNISTAIIQSDPDNKALYEQNTTTYLDKLNVLKAEMMAALELPETHSLMIFSEAFEYFADEFDFELLNADCHDHSHEHEAEEAYTAHYIIELIEIIKDNNCKFIFAEPASDDPVITTISKETNTKILILDPCTTKVYEGKDAYILAMKHNIKTLTEALK